MNYYVLNRARAISGDYLHARASVGEELLTAASHVDEFIDRMQAERVELVSELEQELRQGDIDEEQRAAYLADHEGVVARAIVFRDTVAALGKEDIAVVDWTWKGW